MPKQMILDRIIEISDGQYMPTIAEWRDRRGEPYPSENYIKARLGQWSDIAKELGLKIRRSGGRQSSDYIPATVADIGEFDLHWGGMCNMLMALVNRARREDWLDEISPTLIDYMQPSTIVNKHGKEITQ